MRSAVIRVGVVDGAAADGEVGMEADAVGRRRLTDILRGHLDGQAVDVERVANLQRERERVARRGFERAPEYQVAGRALDDRPALAPHESVDRVAP